MDELQHRLTKDGADMTMVSSGSASKIDNQSNRMIPFML